MSSFVPAMLDSLRLTHGIVAAVRAIGEGKGRQDLYKERAPEVLENLRQVAIIESTESSNRLEGITLPHTAIELLVRRNAEPQAGNRPEAEIAGYRNVLQLIHERHEHMQRLIEQTKESYYDALYQASQGWHEMIGDFSAFELHQRCPSVGVDMLRHILRSERDAGRLQVVGRGRGARWRKLPVAGNGVVSEKRG
jgi:hypothetical protein